MTGKLSAISIKVPFAAKICDLAANFKKTIVIPPPAQYNESVNKMAVLVKKGEIIKQINRIRWPLQHIRKEETY